MIEVTQEMASNENAETEIVPDNDTNTMAVEGNTNPGDPLGDLIDFLAKQSNINFKSQQIGDKELTESEKRRIAKQTYSKSTFVFLTRFGSHLTQSQLEYIESKSFENQDVCFVISQLKNLLVEKNRKLLTKNRRYEALLKLLKEDTYFNEVEMMKRNPLLYDQLIGKYLSKEEKISRDNIDTKNITLLNVLMEGMDKQITKQTLEQQKCDEESQMEESESEEEDNDIVYNQWGEFSKHEPTSLAKKDNNEDCMVTASERSLLREEFIQEMYRSFLAGEDKDVDYSTIDNNTEYDSVDVRGQDEEEKYFDSETPEEAMDQTIEHDNEKNGDESEDELDVYMRHLNSHPSLQHLQHN